jgi:hypothetical protein
MEEVQGPHAVLVLAAWGQMVPRRGREWHGGALSLLRRDRITEGGRKVNLRPLLLHRPQKWGNSWLGGAARIDPCNLHDVQRGAGRMELQWRRRV